MYKDCPKITSDDTSIIACTHCGLFHSDEVLACALIRLAAGAANVGIIRSRDPKDWERSDYVLDVGGQYDGIKFFDHHQAGYNEKREDGTEFSCFGLLWKTLGVTAVRELLLPYKLDDSMILEVVQDMNNFVKGIDLHDQAQLKVMAHWSIDKKVRVEVATLQSIISSANNIPFIDKNDPVKINAKFYKALNFAEDFLERLIYKKASKVIAYKYVTSRIKADSKILFLEEYCDWHEAVSKAPNIIYVIYPSTNGKAYAVQAAKKSPGANTIENLKMPFPEEWAGVAAAALAKLSGVPDVLFCHLGRFIASASTLEGAVALAEKSIQLQISNYERNCKS
jgi:uncharacterized UPF0160 family protein